MNLQLSALAQYTLVCLWLTDWLADCGSCALGQRTLQTSLFGAQPNMMHGVSRTSTAIAVGSAARRGRGNQYR